MPVIASFLFLSLLQCAAPLPHLRIDLVFVGSLRPLAASTAMNEVASIWAPYHVDVHEVDADVPPDGGLRLAVIIAGQKDVHLPLQTLGAIRFRAGTPEPTVLMYVRTIDTMVSATPQARSGDRDILPAVHDVMVGRAFGRALAHEIGHFLLRSQQHAATGLMRATHRTPDLVAPERLGFDLSTDEISRIEEVVSLSHAE